MTGPELATLSTLVWLVGTVSLFILLAEWSSGTSWGLTASLVRGVRGWANHDPGPSTVVSPYVEPLAPLPAPRRPIGGAAAARLPVPEPPSITGRQSSVEIIELGERRLPPR